MAFFAHAFVIVEANINQNRGLINHPLNGTVTITHDSESEVDSQSFKLDGIPLEISLVKNVNLAGNTVVSIYNFTLPAQEKGIHILPSLSAKVGNKIYQSAPTSYEVMDTDQSYFTRPTTKTEGPPILRLEALLQGPNTLYLGDRTTLLYRISYNRSIDLTKSELPFIHINSFLKVGDARISDEQQDNLTVQQISQMIEASQFGTFKIGPSFIEGHAYQINDLGQKVYDKQLLRAEAPALEIVVKQFPAENQPASFNGTLGKIKANMAMKTASEMEIGDTIKLDITLSGVKNLTELRLPSLSCQPGFSGMFQINDLPPAAEIIDNTKLFHVEIRPISSLAKEIPSIEFSSFDLASSQFQIANTEPISINVIPPVTKQKTILAFSEQTLPPNDVLKAMLEQTMPQVELRGNAVGIDDIQLPLLQRGWAIIILPVGLLFLFWQFRKHQKWINRPLLKKNQSELYLLQAIQIRDQEQEAIKLLEKAVWSYMETADNLSSGDKVEWARALLLRLQTAQYSPEKRFDFSGLAQEIGKLLKKD